MGCCKGHRAISPKMLLLSTWLLLLVTPASLAPHSKRPAQQSQDTDREARFRRVCYYTNWSQYRKGGARFLPTNIDPFLCTHIIFAFAKLDHKGHLAPYEWNDIQYPHLYRQFTSLKRKNPHLKTLLAVGGWTMGSDPFSRMVRTKKGRKSFMEHAIQYLRTHKFDGLDLDWEYPGNRGSPPQDKENFSALLKELRAGFELEAARSGRPRLLLAAAVAGGEKIVRTAYEVPALDRYLDFISIMSYDLHGSWSKTLGHNAPLYGGNFSTGEPQTTHSVDDSVKLWISLGASREKLVMGIPFYGRSFTICKDNVLPGQRNCGPGKAGPYTREKGFASYYEMESYLEEGWTRVWLDREKVPYAYNLKTRQWVGYDDIESVQIKAEYIRDEGLGGAMFWALDLDDFAALKSRTDYPLAKTVRSLLDDTAPVSDTHPKSSWIERRKQQQFKLGMKAERKSPTPVRTSPKPPAHLHRRIKNPKDYVKKILNKHLIYSKDDMKKVVNSHLNQLQNRVKSIQNKMKNAKKDFKNFKDLTHNLKDYTGMMDVDKKKIHKERDILLKDSRQSSDSKNSSPVSDLSVSAADGFRSSTSAKPATDKTPGKPVYVYNPYLKFKPLFMTTTTSSTVTTTAPSTTVSTTSRPMSKFMTTTKSTEETKTSQQASTKPDPTSTTTTTKQDTTKTMTVTSVTSTTGESTTSDYQTMKTSVAMISERQKLPRSQVKRKEISSIYMLNTDIKEKAGENQEINKLQDVPLKGERTNSSLKESDGTSSVATTIPLRNVSTISSSTNVPLTTTEIPATTSVPVVSMSEQTVTPTLRSTYRPTLSTTPSTSTSSLVSQRTSPTTAKAENLAISEIKHKTSTNSGFDASSSPQLSLSTRATSTNDKLKSAKQTAETADMSAVAVAAEASTTAPLSTAAATTVSLGTSSANETKILSVDIKTKNWIQDSHNLIRKTYSGTADSEKSTNVEEKTPVTPENNSSEDGHQTWLIPTAGSDHITSTPSQTLISENSGKSTKVSSSEKSDTNTLEEQTLNPLKVASFPSPSASSTTTATTGTITATYSSPLPVTTQSISSVASSPAVTEDDSALNRTVSTKTSTSITEERNQNQNVTITVRLWNSIATNRSFASSPTIPMKHGNMNTALNATTTKTPKTTKSAAQNSTSLPLDVYVKVTAKPLHVTKHEKIRGDITVEDDIHLMKPSVIKVAKEQSNILPVTLTPSTTTKKGHKPVYTVSGVPADQNSSTVSGVSAEITGQRFKESDTEKDNSVVTVITSEAALKHENTSENVIVNSISETKPSKSSTPSTTALRDGERTSVHPNTSSLTSISLSPASRKSQTPSPTVRYHTASTRTEDSPRRSSSSSSSSSTTATTNSLQTSSTHSSTTPSRHTFSSSSPSTIQPMFKSTLTPSPATTKHLPHTQLTLSAQAALSLSDIHTHAPPRRQEEDPNVRLRSKDRRQKPAKDSQEPIVPDHENQIQHGKPETVIDYDGKRKWWKKEVNLKEKRRWWEKEEDKKEPGQSYDWGKLPTWTQQTFVTKSPSFHMSGWSAAEDSDHGSDAEKFRATGIRREDMRAAVDASNMVTQMDTSTTVDKSLRDAMPVQSEYQPDYQPVFSYGPQQYQFQCPTSFGLYPDRQDCRQFYQCVWMVAFHHVCGPGTVWNDGMKICDWPTAVSCRSGFV